MPLTVTRFHGGVGVTSGQPDVVVGLASGSIPSNDFADSAYAARISVVQVASHVTRRS